MGIILENDTQEIELSVKGYEVAMPTESYWDNNWLVLSCRLTGNGKSVYGEFPCFMTMELQRLKTLLEQYQSGTLPHVSWNGTEPNFAVYLRQNHLLTIFFHGKEADCEMTFRKYATAKDEEKLIGFCSDSLSLYPVRDIGIK